jgi:tetratricopeptide (TPR) repeat protein
VIGETVSHYRILSRLGSGGMGEVYLARDTDLDREVALKFISGSLDDSTRERFRREARAAAGLRHPHIVTIYEIGEHAGRPFIAMEHVEGSTVQDLLAEGTLGAARAIEIAIEVCEGLTEAHAAGIVHRDLKPANIRIDASGRARILDFGLARSVDATALTEDGTTVGTVAYMSPEQARGEPVDARSDLFSLGAVLYEMIAGVRTFDADHPAAIAYAVQNEEPQPLARYSREASPELERIVRKALAKDVQTRYQSAADLAADLRQVQGATPVARAPRRRGRTLRWAIPATVVVAAIVATAILRPFSTDRWLGDVAEARPNTLAIMYFENVPEPDDPAHLGEIATNLLITDLSESRFIRVLSSQRLYDILRLKGKEGLRVIDRETASDVARHAGTQRMLLGSILRTEPTIVMTSQLVDVASGEVVGSQRVTGAEGEDVFALVDRLSGRVRADLDLPRQAATETDVLVADVTTHSEEAYRQYVIGLDARNRFLNNRAVEAFTRAVEIDSTFAMAWLQLSRLGNIFHETRSNREALHALEQAVRYSDRVGRRERRRISARQAVVSGKIDRAVEELGMMIEEDPDDEDAHSTLAWVYANCTGDLDRAVHHLRRVIEIDPMNTLAYNELSYLYMRRHNLERAIQTVNRYVELAPDQANPYDSRGDIYASFGVVDSAIASYRTAFETNSYFYLSQFKLAGLCMLQGDYERALEEVDPLLSSDRPLWRATGRMLLVTIPAHRGRARDTIAAADETMAADREDGLEGDWRCQLMSVTKAKAQLRIGQNEACLATFAAMDDGDEQPQSWYDVVWRGVKAQSLARMGRFDEADATLDRAEMQMRSLNYLLLDVVYLFRARIDLIRGDIPSSRRWTQESLAHGGQIPTRINLALCDIVDGNPADAVTELEFQCTCYQLNRMRDSFLNAELRYHLARAYEKTGQVGKASEKYAEFLDMWKDADPDIRLLFPDPRDPDDRPLDFARRLLEALKSGI